MSINVPVVLFFFKRKNKTLEVLKKIREVKPPKIYLFSDGGRNDEESLIISELRIEIEKLIDWNCEIFKFYSDVNQGVFNQIGLGSLKVFRLEKFAIFLEDDNLPTLSFFYFCEELLYKFQDNDKILWICGTNYSQNLNKHYKYDYYFSQNLFPCGWASWSHKFLKYYQADFEKLNNLTLNNIKKRYTRKELFKIDVKNWKREIQTFKRFNKFISWDYHMSFTLRYFDLYGIVAVKNQIKNIGVDNDSIHGGSSISNIMVKRLTSMDHYELKFPLSHPEIVKTNKKFEKLISDLLIPPIVYRVKASIKGFFMKAFNYNHDTKTKDAIYKWLKNIFPKIFK